MTRDFISSSFIPQHPSLKANIYKVVRRSAGRYAKSIDRELAEGPTYLVLDTEHFGPPIELWPLVWEGGESDAISG